MERFKPELGKSVKLLGLTVEQDSTLNGYMVQMHQIFAMQLVRNSKAQVEFAGKITRNSKIVKLYQKSQNCIIIIMLEILFKKSIFIKKYLMGNLKS